MDVDPQLFLVLALDFSPLRLWRCRGYACWRCLPGLLVVASLSLLGFARLQHGCRLPCEPFYADRTMDAYTLASRAALSCALRHLYFLDPQIGLSGFSLGGGLCLDLLTRSSLAWSSFSVHGFARTLLGEHPLFRQSWLAFAHCGSSQILRLFSRSVFSTMSVNGFLPFRVAHSVMSRQTRQGSAWHSGIPAQLLEAYSHLLAVCQWTAAFVWCH